MNTMNDKAVAQVPFFMAEAALARLSTAVRRIMIALIAIAIALVLNTTIMIRYLYASQSSAAERTTQVQENVDE